MMDLPVGAKFAIGIALFAIWGLAGLAAPKLLSSAWEDYTKKPPNITMRRVGFVWVDSGQNIYQLGAIVTLQNIGATAYQALGVSLNASTPILYPRGGAHLTNAFVLSEVAEAVDGNLLRPNEETVVRFLLPIKVALNRQSPGAPAVGFVGKWSLILKDAKLPLQPELFGTLDRPVNQREWRGPLDLSSVDYSVPTPPPVADAPWIDTLIFNPDPSARFSVLNFTNGRQVSGPRGTMAYVRGQGDPPLNGGWVIWGHTYDEVWRDPEKLAIYNSLFPPDKEGKPQVLVTF